MSLDQEWVELILKAIHLGISTDEVRDWLKTTNKEV